MSVLNPEIERILGFVPILRDILGDGVIIAVNDREKYLFNEDGKDFSLGVRQGNPIVKGGATVMNTGRSLTRRVPKEVLGVPYHFSGVPIKDDGATPWSS